MGLPLYSRVLTHSLKKENTFFLCFTGTGWDLCFWALRVVYSLLTWDCFPQIRLDLGYLLTQAVNPHKRKAATFYL